MRTSRLRIVAGGGEVLLPLTLARGGGGGRGVVQGGGRWCLGMRCCLGGGGCCCPLLPSSRTTPPPDHVTYPMMNLVSHLPPVQWQIDKHLWKHHIRSLHYAGGNNRLEFITTRQRSCGKVLFSQACSFCPLGGSLPSHNAMPPVGRPPIYGQPTGGTQTIWIWYRVWSSCIGFISKEFCDV